MPLSSRTFAVSGGKRPKTSRNVFGRLGLAIGIALGQLVLQVCIADCRTDGVVIRILVANDDGRCRHVLPLFIFSFPHAAEPYTSRLDRLDFH